MRRWFEERPVPSTAMSADEASVHKSRHLKELSERTLSRSKEDEHKEERRQRIQVRFRLQLLLALSCLPFKPHSPPPSALTHSLLATTALLRQ